MPFELLKLAHNEGITVEYWDFVPPIEGVYLILYGRPFISLSNSLFSDRRRFRCVLAEELGHHFRTGGKTNGPFFCYRDRLMVSKEEYKALSWAAKYLIPINELKEAIYKGVHELWELAEYFDVTEEMVKFRLKLSDIASLKYVSVNDY